MPTRPHLDPTRAPAPVELAELRARVAERARSVGVTELGPLQLYRFDRPTFFHKAPTFGVTLGVVLAGQKQLRLGPHRITVDPRRHVVMTRESAHDSIIRPGRAGEPYLGVSLGFGPELVARALVALADSGQAPVREAMPAFGTPMDRDVVGALERIVRASADPVEARLLVPLAVEEILFRLLRSPAAVAVRSAVGSAPDSAPILEAMHILRSEHAADHDVRSVARRVGMSASHFAHRFRAVTRTTPMRFLRDARLERARSLLVEPGMRAGVVAGEVGFRSSSHFTREFKRRYGVSPGAYQARAG
ncbi:MAG: AraC family transcriptional regulator [Sandaracinus sp.]